MALGSPHSLRARWCWSPSLGWQKNVQIELQGDRFGARSSLSKAPSQLLLPGWINLHTHLELSHCLGQCSPGLPFSQWVAQLRQITQSWQFSNWLESMDSGQKQCLKHGTTTVLDLGNSGANLQIQPRLRLWALHEIMGLNEDLALSRWQAGEEQLTRLQSHEMRRSGLTPHAPFSTSRPLLQRLLNSNPWSIHVDESAEEQQFFQDGTGGLGDLARFLAPQAKWTLGQGGGLRELQRHGLVPSDSVLVHANHSQRSELVQAKSQGTTLVHCPQSRAFFGHSMPDLQLWKDLQMQVALGTDSLASSPSLSLWDELQLFCQSQSVYDLEESMKMLSSVPAQALNQAHGLGDLLEGFYADWQMIEIPTECEDPAQWLLQAKIKPAQVGLAGQIQDLEFLS